MSTEENEEWEDVVGIDGNTYRVLKNPPPPSPPLPVSDDEARAIDGAISYMAKVAGRRGISTKNVRSINDDEVLCKKIDKLIAECLVDIKPKVQDDPAEKMFERLMRAADSWPVDNEARSLGIVAIRFVDTMNYMVAYRGRFRGVERSRVMYSKDEALAVLKQRGLTRR